MAHTTHSKGFLQEVADVAQLLDPDQIERIVGSLGALRSNESRGRLFIVGSGGGAGHASHAVCDFRKLCDIEAYAPTDNVSELTARINDDGWDSSLENWLITSRLNSNDALFVFSVGGGSREYEISMNLVRAVELAKQVGAYVVGIVGKNDGVTAQLADECIVVPASSGRLTPVVEGYQAIIWHAIVSHPQLSVQEAKWESVVDAKS